MFKRPKVFFTNSFLPTKGGVEIGLHHLANEYSKKESRRVLIVGLSGSSRIIVTSRYTFIGATRLCRYPVFAFVMLLVVRIFCLRQCYVVQLFPTGSALLRIGKVLGLLFTFRSAGGDLQVYPEFGYGRISSVSSESVSRFFRLAGESRFVAVSPEIYSRYVELGVNPSQIVCASNGIDYGSFSSVSPRTAKTDLTGVYARRKGVVCVSRNHPKKRLEIFCRAAKRNPNVDFTLVTDTLTDLPQWFIGVPNLRVVEDRCPAIPSKNVLTALQAARVFFLPSGVEAFGNVFLEAAAAGLAVAGFEVEGVTSTVAGIPCSELISSNDDSLVDLTLFRLLNASAQDLELNRDYAAAFDWKNVCAQLIEKGAL